MALTLAEQASQDVRAGPGSLVPFPFQRLQPMERVAEKSFPDVSVLTTTASPITIFTVTGLISVKLVGWSPTVMASTGTNGTLAVGWTGLTTLGLGTTTVDGTNFVANAVWVDTSPAAIAEALVASNLVGVLTASNIIVTVATNNCTTGSLKIYAIWRPISPDAAVTVV